MKPLVIDFHADTLFKRHYAQTLKLLTAKIPIFHVTKDKLLAGGVDVQTMALFTPSTVINLSIELTLQLISYAYEMRDKEGYILIKTKTDFTKVIPREVPGIILSIEGAKLLENNLDLLPVFYELGVRAIGLVWSRKNYFGQGVPAENEGISEEGKDLISRMEDLGMIVDVSHLNEKGFADVVKYTNNPFIASHSNSQTLCSSKRNLTDSQLMELKSVDGIIGINFCPAFLNNDATKASITDIFKHIDYISNLIGVDHIGLGSDFDGITQVPKGMEDVSKIKEIPTLLLESSYSKKDVEKIMGGNFSRIISKVWKK